MSEKRIPLVFCIDSGALIGLHVTASTALSHLGEGAMAEIHLLNHRVAPQEIDLLRRTLDRCGKPYEIHPQPVDPARFTRMKWLGGFMTYVRLLIPEMVDLPRVIYLDADLIVYADLKQLFEMDLGGKTIGAASWGGVRDSNDRAFFQSLNRSVETPYFNAGVLLVDCDQWRQREITRQCLQIGDQHTEGLPSADQTILNLYFDGDFCQIPRRFNTPVTASRETLRDDQMVDRIVHLVARPKPWDMFGFLNGQYKAFCRELKRTEMSDYRPDYYSLQSWKKAARLGKAYLKCLTARRKSG